MDLLKPEGWFEWGHDVLVGRKTLVNYGCQVIVPEPWYGHRLQAGVEIP